MFLCMTQQNLNLSIILKSFPSKNIFSQIGFEKWKKNQNHHNFNKMNNNCGSNYRKTMYNKRMQMQKANLKPIFSLL